MPQRTRLDTAYEAARMYYDGHRTMEDIATQLNVSRSTVSRLLRDARDAGLVRIALRPPDASRVADLRGGIKKRYGVRTRVVPARPDDSQQTRLHRVAAEAAEAVDVLVQPEMTVGIAWGTTLSALADELRARPVRGLKVVQLNGAVNTQSSGMDHVTSVIGLLGTKWQAQAVHFPVPAFFDHASTREALWRERSVQRVLDQQAACSLAVFSVGAFDAEVPSHVHASGYLSPADLDALHADGAVADVCTVFLRADGSWRDLPINQRSSGVDPDRLARIPRRVLVASGARKAGPVHAALLARVATDVVIDEATATALLALD